MILIRSFYKTADIHNSIITSTNNLQHAFDTPGSCDSYPASNIHGKSFPLQRRYESYSMCLIFLVNPLQQECRICSILCVASMNEKVWNVLLCLLACKSFEFVHVF